MISPSASALGLAGFANPVFPLCAAVFAPIGALVKTVVRSFHV